VITNPGNLSLSFSYIKAIETIQLLKKVAKQGEEGARNELVPERRISYRTLTEKVHISKEHHLKTVDLLLLPKVH